MRVTNNMQTQSVISSILSNQSKVAELQTQLTTNKKVNSASDDPGSVPVIMNADSALNKIDIYLDNISKLNGEVDVTEGVLSQFTDRIQRLKDLAIEAANGTNSAEQLKMINDEVKQIKEQIVSLANTKYKDTYIFAGNKTGTIPYEISDNGSIYYHGTSGSGAYKREYAISDGVTVSINLAGDNVFGYSNLVDPGPPAVYEGTGLMHAVNSLSMILEQDTPNYDAIRGQLDVLDDAQNSILTARTENGAIQTRLNMTKEQHENSQISYKTIQANVQEIDIAQVVSQLSNQQVSLQASMYVGSQISSISLLDYL